MITSFKIFEISGEKIKPEHIYLSKPDNRILLYIGYNGSEFPFTFFNLTNKKHLIDDDVIERGEGSYKKINITLKEFIIKNGIVNNFIERLSSNYIIIHKKSTTRELVKNLKNKLLKDQDIQLAIKSEKFNI